MAAVSARQSGPKVAIIGAGMSGIGAANALYTQGVKDVTVFEASDRIGGRVWTKYFDDDGVRYRLDMGANWIHGTKNNPVFTIAKEKRLLSKPNTTKWPKFSRYEASTYTTEGTEVSSKLFNEVSSWYSEAIAACDQLFHEHKNSTCNGLSKTSKNSADHHNVKDSECNDLRQNSKELVNNQNLKDSKCNDRSKKSKESVDNQNVEDFIRRRFDSHLAAHPASEVIVDLKRRILNHKLMMETSLSGCHSMIHVSLGQFGSYVELEGRHPDIMQGFIRVLDALADPLPDRCIRLNAPVRRVHYQQASNSHQVLLELEGGETETFDCVIITSSLKYLQENHLALFSPALPPSKQRSLRALDMGTVNKIFLQYESLDFLPARCSRLTILQPLSDDLTRWTSRLYAVHPVNTPRDNTLQFWLTGRGAEEMEELTEEEVARGCTELLKAVLGVDSLPEPTRVIRTQWHSERYIRGSYTYIPVGATVEDIQELAEPIMAQGKPVVLFAGEATHPEYYSTTHGALLSGRREAQRLIHHY